MQSQRFPWQRCSPFPPPKKNVLRGNVFPPIPLSKTFPWQRCSPPPLSESRNDRKIALELNHYHSNLVALYRAIRLRFGYGFESCDANGPRKLRNIQSTNLAKHRAVSFPPFLLVASKESVLTVPKRGQFHAAIRVTRT